MEIRTQFKEQVIEKSQKRTRNFFVRLICVAFFGAIYLSYFALPISKAKSCIINGNYYLSREQIFSIAGINESTFLFNIDVKNIDEYLNNYPLISKSDIKCSFFNFKINIDEKSPAVKDKDDNIYLKDGTNINKEELKSVFNDDKINALPYILKDNDNYYSFNDDTRYILYELSLIFVAIYNINVDFVDFDKENKYFSFYIVNEKNKNEYVEFLFDAACVSDNYNSNSLSLMAKKFNSCLSTFFDDFGSSSYAKYTFDFNDESYSYCKRYVYPEKKGTNNVEITINEK